LREFVARDEDDSFSRYGLAMEYVKVKEYDQALEHFALLIRKDPGYIAAYYHMGKTLEAAGRTGEAPAIYEAGIRIGKEKNDAHAVSELYQALDEL
jgi:tetratricopeptide (TPR) repeat protein